MAQVITSSDLSAYPSLSGQNLTDLASEVEGFLRGYLRRKILVSETGSETFRLASSRDRIYPDEWPITAISSITIGGTTVSSALYEIDGLGIYKSSGWPAESKIVANYTAGYTSGGLDHLALKRAAKAIALILARSSADPTDATFGLGQVRRLKLGDYEVESAAGISQAGSADRLPDEIERILRPYRRGPRVA